MPLGGDDPAQPPTGHVEVLGEARDDEEVVGQRECRARRALVGQAEVDLVDDQPSAEVVDRAGDARHLVVSDHRAGGIRRRGDQRRTRASGPVARDRLRRELVVLRGTDGHADRRPFEHAHEVPVARIAGVGEQHLLVPVQQQRHHQQQRRGRARGDDDPLRGRRRCRTRRRSGARSRGAARQGRAPRCSGCGRRRVPRGRRPAPGPGSGSRARRSPCAPRCGRWPRVRARRSAPPSRGTARCRQRARRDVVGAPSNGRVRARRGRLYRTPRQRRPSDARFPRTRRRGAGSPRAPAPGGRARAAGARRHCAPHPRGVQVHGRARGTRVPGHTVPARAGAPRLRGRSRQRVGGRDARARGRRHRRPRHGTNVPRVRRHARTRRRHRGIPPSAGT